MASGTAEQQAMTAITGTREDHEGRAASDDSRDQHHLFNHRGEDGSSAWIRLMTVEARCGLLGASTRRSSHKEQVVQMALAMMPAREHARLDSASPELA
uniref:Uncharacterized protein n=1 Tax=Oryza glumipatula TaxID=40148 RepID=A0A0E0B0E5_9ORYZ